MPSYTPVNVVWGQAAAAAALGLIAQEQNPPLTESAVVRLSTNPAFNPTPTSTVASLAATEADFSGYTAGGTPITTWAVANQSAVAQGAMASVLFLATSATPFVDGIVYGYWIDNGSIVLVAERFANSQFFTFGSPGDYLELLTVLPFQLNQAST